MSDPAVFSSAEDPTLQIAARRSCARQWRSFIEALAHALPEVVGDEIALDVIERVGKSVAAANPVPACSSLPELQTAMNKSMDALDWGHVVVSEAGRRIELMVSGYPHLPSVHGQAVFAAALEAVLNQWMSVQGSRRDLAVRLRASGAGRYPPLLYHFERSEGD
jgi:uncharacterized membrane-anchored protein